MYMMTPNDQISQDLSYFSGPKTSGAEIDKKGLSLYSNHLGLNKVSKIIQCWSIILLITYQHNKGYNMVSEACRGLMFPSQIQSLLTSALL